MYLKELWLNNIQQLTLYIKNRRNSNKFKGFSNLQSLCCLIGECNKVAYYLYTYR